MLLPYMVWFLTVEITTIHTDCWRGYNSLMAGCWWICGSLGSKSFLPLCMCWHRCSLNPNGDHYTEHQGWNSEIGHECTLCGTYVEKVLWEIHLSYSESVSHVLKQGRNVAYIVYFLNLKFKTWEDIDFVL